MATASKIDNDRLKEISRTLLDARRRAGSLPGFPCELPPTLADAYAIQALSRADYGHPISGWKVGGIPPAQAEILGANFLAGPIFAPQVVHAEGEAIVHMPIFADGGAAIEPEFVVRLGATRAEDRVFIGVEIASSPIVGINQIGALAVVSDFGNNRGLLVGPEIENWREALAQPVTVKSYIDGEEVGARELDGIAQIAGPRDFLIEHAAHSDIALPVGTLISTGAITGIHDAVVGASSTLDFGEFGQLDIELVPAHPEV